ncbi:MAG TPA: hypothetical protein PKN92_11895, partial [Candidatus Hydrogenedentes bacterium]|nr:hypothetical protein [Candidatus Hydrogenedentota bacterium]
MTTILLCLSMSLLTVAAADEAPGLAVMSYNIHHAEGMDGKIDLDRIAAVVLESGADIVCFQEV